jgi:replicative DNA helicase
LSVSNELLLISAMLRTKDHILPASRGISSKMFKGYQTEYAWIEDYVAMHGRTPSIGAFRSAFEDVYLKKVDDLEYFIEQVREENSTRVLRKGLNDVIAKLKAGDTKGAIEQLSSASVAAEASYLGHGADGDIFRDYDDIKQEVLRRKRQQKKTGFAGIPTGFPTLDELTSGIQPGWFVVVTARTGVGKTRSLVRMACAAAFSGYNVQYDALEQTRPEIAMQVHAFASSEFGQGVFKSLDLAQGNGYDTKSYLKFLQDMKGTVQGRMHVADNTRGSITHPTMAAQVERNRADVLYLDHLTLVDGVEDHQSAANLSSSLKKMATKYRIPVITAAQINRGGIGKKIQDTGDIGVSDKIGQDADLVINVQKFSKNVVLMRVIKFRHGPSGQVFYLKFDPNQGVMEEITYDEAMDMKDQDGDDEEHGPKKFVPRKKGSFHQAATARKAVERPREARGGTVARKPARSPQRGAVRLKRPQ